MRFRRGRGFWRAWRDEQRRLWDEHRPHPPHGPFPPGPPPPEIARAWRDFFHSFMGEWPEEHWAFGGRRFSPWRHGIDTFNPFVASLLSKGGGLLPLLVLHLLAEQPRYGNELMSLIAERTAGQAEANPGALYPLMNLLEVRGFVQGDWEDPRKRTIRVYRLTEAGHEELARLKSIVRPKLKEAVEVLQTLVSSLNGDETEGDETEGDEPPPIV